MCDPADCSPPGSSVYGILQARILQWVAMSSSRGSSCPRDRTHISCISHLGRRILYSWDTWEAPDQDYTGCKCQSLTWSPVHGTPGPVLLAALQGHPCNGWGRLLWMLEMLYVPPGAQGKQGRGSEAKPASTQRPWNTPLTLPVGNLRDLVTLTEVGSGQTWTCHRTRCPGDPEYSLQILLFGE